MLDRVGPISSYSFFIWRSSLFVSLVMENTLAWWVVFTYNIFLTVPDWYLRDHCGYYMACHIMHQNSQFVPAHSFCTRKHLHYVAWWDRNTGQPTSSQSGLVRGGHSDLVERQLRSQAGYRAWTQKLWNPGHTKGVVSWMTLVYNLKFCSSLSHNKLYC